MNHVNKRSTGNKAENVAGEFLEQHGLKILKRNYRCAHGEIDLIMQDQDDIVFVEVRSRSRFDYGSPIATIDRCKIQKLIKTALHFLQKQKWINDVSSRFDVVGIQIIQNKLQFEWIKNAFTS